MDNIIVCALHQHTSGRLGVWPWTGSIEDEHYLDVLHRKFCDVCRMAIDDMKEAVPSTAIRETDEPVAFIRRYKMKDGSTKTNPGFLNPDIDHPIGEADNRVRLIRFKRKEGGDIALVNFMNHPDCIGGLKFSADWPGFVRRFVEEDIKGAHCVFVNGCQGDTNHWNSAKPEPFDGGQSYRQSREIGRIIADAVVKTWDDTEDRPEGKMFAEVEMVMTPSNRSDADKRDYYAKIVREYAEGVKHSATVLGKARRVLNLDRTPMELKIPVTVQGFSNIAFVGFGGEPFTQYATNMTAAAPGTFVVPIGLCNGQEGYLPNADAFAEGGYEADSSRFTESLPSDLQGAAKKLFEKYGVK
ncbi:MAG: hypothetical protein IJS65_04625, partial [Clostridia bacterium]|nr:hypothetical protein [Clostridia bacterium]